MKLNILRVFYVNQKVPKQEEGATYKKACGKKMHCSYFKGFEGVGHHIKFSK